MAVVGIDFFEAVFGGAGEVKGIGGTEKAGSWSVGQHEVETAILHYVRSRNCVDFRFNWELRDFEETDDGVWRIHFYRTLLATFDERDYVIRP